MSGAAVTGGVLALGGSVLLLFATFLPLIEIDGFIDSSVTIWDATSRPSEVFIPLLVAIAVNSLYVAFGSSGGRRVWAIVALGINITVMYYLLAQIVGIDVEGTGPGSASTRWCSRPSAS